MATTVIISTAHVVHFRTVKEHFAWLFIFLSFEPIHSGNQQQSSTIATSYRYKRYKASRSHDKYED